MLFKNILLRYGEKRFIGELREDAICNLLESVRNSTLEGWLQFLDECIEIAVDYAVNCIAKCTITTEKILQSQLSLANVDLRLKVDYFYIVLAVVPFVVTVCSLICPLQFEKFPYIGPDPWILKRSTLPSIS